jgi:protein TonB
VVGKDGTLTDVTVIRGIGGGCDEEAIRVVKYSPSWKPGKQRGKPVKVKMVLPVTFKII